MSAWALVTTAVNHHLVSAGYQRNFGTDDHFLGVVEARTGRLVAKRRAIRSNWRERHWNSTFDPVTGEVDTSLEDGFSERGETRMGSFSWGLDPHNSRDRRRVLDAA